MVVWCVFFLHSTLPSQQPPWWVAPSPCGCNISSSIPAYSLTSVLLVDICPASSEHTSSPGGFQLAILAYTLFVGKRRSWQTNRLSCALWLPNYCIDVLLTAIVSTSHSDRSGQRFVSNIPVLGSFFPFVHEFVGHTSLTWVA